MENSTLGWMLGLNSMSKPPYLPDQGDLIWLVLDPRTGHEQSGRKPALVLSPRLFTERTGLATICPVTSKLKGLPFEVILTGCQTTGAVLPIHLRSVDVVARKATFIEQVPAKVVEKVRQHLALILGQA